MKANVPHQTHVIQIPTEYARFATGYIDNYVKDPVRAGRIAASKAFIPSRCYVAEKDVVLVWRAFSCDKPFLDGILDCIHAKSKEYGFEYHYRAYNEDDKAEGKIFRCIPEVPGALCIQFPKLKGILCEIYSENKD